MNSGKNGIDSSYVCPGTSENEWSKIFNRFVFAAIYFLYDL